MMQLSKERREAYVEVLEILNNMDSYYKERVPLKLRKFFEENASKEYKFYIDLSKPFEENELKKITLNVLAMLNLNYWCETKEEKQKWKNIYVENEKKHEEELQIKYNLDNVFNKRKEQTLKKRIEDKKSEEKHFKKNGTVLKLLEHRETLLKKIINKIKQFFYRY